MHKFILLLALFLTSISLSHASSLDTISVSQIINQHNGLILEPYLQYLEDNGGKLTISDLKSGAYNSQFKQYKREELPQNNSTIWLRFAIKNQDTQSEQDLVFGTNLFDYITFYLPNRHSNLEEYQTGNRIAISKKSINKDANSYVDIYLQPNYCLVCYAKVKIEKKLSFHFTELKPTLYSKKNFDHAFRNQIIFGSIFFGIAFIMLIYNLLLFFIVRDKSYIYYIFYTATMLGFGFAASGEINSILGFDAYLHNKIILVFGILITIFYILFTRSLFLFKNSFPLWNKVISACFVILIVALGLTLIDAEWLAIPICFADAIIAMGTVVTLAVIIVFRGYTPGRYFIAATLLNYIGVSTMTLQMLQILPEEIFGLRSSNYFELAAALQLAFFSLALGSRINLLKSEIVEKQLQQEQILREEEQKRLALIEKQNEELEIKVQERTIEISERNEELLQQQEEIGLINEQLTQQSSKVNLQNTQILDSLNYARRIQSALLPSKKQLELELTDHFVIWKPKNIVSGDFYWYKKMDNHIVIVVADCTGHGVPGAFMSMLGVAFLNEIVRDGINKKASDILEMLRDYVKLSLNQSGGYNENKDGMDISLCIIHKETLQMEHAGAHNPVYIIRKNNEPEVEFKNKEEIINARVSEVKKHKHEDRTLYHVSSDLQPIGVFVKEFPFNNKIIQLYPNDRIYLATDGITDQIGGPKSQKFKTQALKDCLLDTSNMELSTQAVELERIIHSWKGNHEQIDDMLLFGFQI